MKKLQFQERIDTPGWPMMEVRRERLPHMDASRMSLCCIDHGNVYAQYVVTDCEWDMLVTKRAVFTHLAKLAERGKGWLWYIRERMAEMQVGDHGVMAFAEQDRDCAKNVGDKVIGWPQAYAGKRKGRIDEIVCGFGVGAGSMVGQSHDLYLNKWCGLRDNDVDSVLIGQAFVANVKQTLAGVLEKNKDNESIKKVTTNMRKNQGRIVEDVWRMPVYETVESLCAMHFSGVEVFHADEEMTWTMFLNERRT